MYQMVYTSKASEDILIDSERHISNILDKANKNNLDMSVTGLLIYNSGYFLQLLEGSKESVNKIYQKIAKDQRHSTIKVILKQEANSRIFESWAMASCNLDIVSDHHFFKNERAKNILQSCLDGEIVDEFKILDLFEFFRINYK